MTRVIPDNILQAPTPASPGGFTKLIRKIVTPPPASPFLVLGGARPCSGSLTQAGPLSPTQPWGTDAVLSHFTDEGTEAQRFGNRGSTRSRTEPEVHGPGFVL